jgi:hypothetical protein
MFLLMPELAAQRHRELLEEAAAYRLRARSRRGERGDGGASANGGRSARYLVRLRASRSERRAVRNGTCPTS